jgi:hypothetical protein
MSNTKPAYKYSDYKYSVNGTEGFTLSEALRLWKTKYADDFRDFEKEVITHSGLHDFRDFVKETWDDITPVTVEEALQISNTEIRRIYFDAIGVNKLFSQLNPTLRDKQVIKKKRHRWDENNSQYEYEFEDVYELYEIDGEKLFGLDRWGNKPDPVFAVRCWCTTTNREYWLYVNTEAATGRNWLYGDRTDEVYDAIRAIAWTIRIDITKPERIYRQGDIIVVKESVNSVFTSQYHLNKEEYLSLMYSET